MNDRFKFRCWNKEQQKLYSWDDLEKSKGDNSFYWCMLQAQNYEKNNILMQCTGLKDKNGKLIYEGDIISCQGKAVIAYSDDKALFYAHYFNTVGICEWYLFELKKIFAQCEVIGNIYENKELLEDTECQK